jgi:cell division septation protein DedD
MDMPLVFGLLVVFNAVFLAWQFFEQQNHGQGTIVVVEEQEGKSLQLLTERTDLVRVENTTTAESSGTTNVKSQEDLACYRVGPILDNDMLKQVRAIFEKSGFDIKVTTTNGSNDKYWVYIPPLATSEKAQAVLAELQKHDVDGAVVTDAQLANAISLGTVNSSDKADAIKSKLMALGYRAESKTTSTSRDEQWLLLNNVGTVGTAQIDRILVGSPQIRRERTSCR